MGFDVDTPWKKLPVKARKAILEGCDEQVHVRYRNRYGHPAEPVLQRYQERHIVVHDSPHCGAMRWRSDQPTELLCERTVAMHYWSHHVP